MECLAREKFCFGGTIFIDFLFFKYIKERKLGINMIYTYFIRHVFLVIFIF